MTTVQRHPLDHESTVVACLRELDQLNGRALGDLLELIADSDWTEPEELAEFGGRDAAVELVFDQLRAIVREIYAMRSR